MTAATDGAVVYELVDSCPPAGVCFGVSGRATDSCGVDATPDSEFYLSSGEIVCDPRQLRRYDVALHEMGHTFGLQHASGIVLMCGAVDGVGECVRELDEFTPKEQLVMKLMLQRLTGNMFPDNDRAVTQRATLGGSIRCQFVDSSGT
jgi:hypothetical protein